jgi:hypothetical protein
MALNSTQLAVFKAAILADPALIPDRTAGNTGAIAAYYNVNGTGNIWKPAVPTPELNTAVVWSEFTGLSAQLQNTYQTMITPGFLDATSPNIRGGITACFTAGTATRTNLTNIAQRPPTRFEALFVSASASAIYGQLCTNELVIQALGS